jgi:hypothetical protein
LLCRFDTVDCPLLPREDCFTAFLSDTYGDGWNSNVLTIENEGTGEVVHQLTQSGAIETSVDAHVEEAFEVCFECESCFVADVGGGTFETETAWNIKDAQGGTIAEGSGVAGGSNSDRFCTADCLSTVCEPGKQPNAEDSGCEPCVPGKHSSTTSNTQCAECVPGTHAAEEGAIGCQQLRIEVGRSEREDNVSLTNFLVAVRGRQGERDSGCRCLHRVYFRPQQRGQNLVHLRARQRERSRGGQRSGSRHDEDPAADQRGHPVVRLRGPSPG